MKHTLQIERNKEADEYTYEEYYSCSMKPFIQLAINKLFRMIKSYFVKFAEKRLKNNLKQKF